MMPKILFFGDEKGGKEGLPTTKVSDRCCTSTRTFQIASRLSTPEGKRLLWRALLAVTLPLEI